MCKVLRVLHLITVEVNGLSLKGQEPSKRNNKHGLDSRGNNVSTTANVKAQELPNLYCELCVHGQCVTSSVVSACGRVVLLSRRHVVVSCCLNVVVSPYRHFVVSACWPHVVPPCRHVVLSPCRRVVVSFCRRVVVWSNRCGVVSSRRRAVLSSNRRHIVSFSFQEVRGHGWCQLWGHYSCIVIVNYSSLLDVKTSLRVLPMSTFKKSGASFNVVEET